MTTDTPAGVRYAPHGVILSVGYVVFGYAAVPGVYRSLFRIDFAAFGLLMSAALGAFVLAQWPASRLMRQYSTTDLLLAGTLLHAILAVVADFAGTFQRLLAVRFTWGLTAGFLLSVGASHVATHHSGPRATLQQGFYGGMLTLGGALGFLAAPTITASGGVFGVHAGGAVIALLPAVALTVNRPGRSNPTETRTAANAATTSTPGTRQVSPSEMLTSPAVVLAALCYVALIASYITLSTFVTDYFRTLGVLGALNVGVLVTASVGRIGGGLVVARRLATDTTLIGSAALASGLGLVGMAVLDGTALLVLPVLVMLAVSVPFGAVFNVAATATPDQGTALAIVVAAGNVAALVLPAVTGWLRDTTGSYSPGFLALATLNAVAVAAALALHRRTRTNT